jgi:hypothetical protein
MPAFVLEKATIGALMCLGAVVGCNSKNNFRTTTSSCILIQIKSGRWDLIIASSSEISDDIKEFFELFGAVKLELEESKEPERQR